MGESHKMKKLQSFDQNKKDSPLSVLLHSVIKMSKVKMVWKT